MSSTISLFAITFSIVSFVTSLIAIVMVLAQKWSTHTIEWKPLESYDPFKEAEEEAQIVDSGDEKVLEEALKLQRKKKKESVEDPLDKILETNNF